MTPGERVAKDATLVAVIVSCLAGISYGAVTLLRTLVA